MDLRHLAGGRRRAAWQLTIAPSYRVLERPAPGTKAPGPVGRPRQNLPLPFFQSGCGGIVSMVSQCSAILPFCTRNRS